MASQEHVLLSTEQYNRLMDRIKRFENEKKASETNNEHQALSYKPGELRGSPTKSVDVSTDKEAGDKQPPMSRSVTNSDGEKKEDGWHQPPTGSSAQTSSSSTWENPRHLSESLPVTTRKKKITKRLIKTKLLPPGKRAHTTEGVKKSKTKKIWVTL